MIQANELRIGNLLKTTDGEFVAVTGLPLGRSHSEWNVEANYSDYDFKDLDPIPLTPEILERFGFEMDAAPQVPEWHHESGFWFFDCWGTDSYSIRLMNKIDVHLKHLHQLQNFYFALTGEELQISVFENKTK